MSARAMRRSISLQILSIWSPSTNFERGVRVSARQDTRLHCRRDALDRAFGQIGRDGQAEKTAGKALGYGERVPCNIREIRVMVQAAAVPQAKIDTVSLQTIRDAVRLP